MYMTNIKFKNFYILNLKSNELLFNMQQLRVINNLSQGSQKYKHIYHNEQLIIQSYSFDIDFFL